MKECAQGKRSSMEENRITDDHLKKILDWFRRKKLFLTTVESCTGGLLAGRITDIPGSSDVFHQGFVTYCDDAKHQLVQVKEETLEKYTAVSPQTAEEMARGGAEAAKADACLSVTGYAGPPSCPGDTSVGLVYVGCFFLGETRVREFHFSGNRREVREAAVEAALRLLEEFLPEDISLSSHLL